jgi:hypothetical protein
MTDCRDLKHARYLMHGLIPVALAGIVLFFALCSNEARAQPDSFIVKPYLQIGYAPRSSGHGSLVLMWHAEDLDQAWTVEFRKGMPDCKQAKQRPRLQRDYQDQPVR